MGALFYTVTRNYRNQENSFPFAGILGIWQKQLQWGWEDPKSDSGGIYKPGWTEIVILVGIWVDMGEGTRGGVIAYRLPLVRVIQMFLATLVLFTSVSH